MKFIFYDIYKVKWIDDQTCVVCVAKMKKNVTVNEIIKDCPYEVITYEDFAQQKSNPIIISKVNEPELQQQEKQKTSIDVSDGWFDTKTLLSYASVAIVSSLITFVVMKNKNL